MSNNPLIPHELAVTRLQDALRLRVGRGKRYSVQGLADAARIKPRTIESYLSGDATPGLNGFISLCAVLGPAFTSDVLAEAGLVARSADADEPEHMRAISLMSEGTRMIADALADGYVDHQERAKIKPHADRIIAIMEPLARTGETTIPHLGEVKAR
ncbi:hypothetical protein RIdsm_02515 [Roseovarius indicus]|uniref:Uncharacterized protein n=1 Tax=Roseovarius indicus TaxID=540747 RepID=A0A0T5P924_9RHOB|nr:hypothetical protein [Roseovarius indicus]KRS17512.1 hypothetical protein XM52_13600 [Roseovarius indicus]QEW26713.1 hypothetical protein RIdsm_02515 [Roseovarius indicus]SFD61225.1 hypothetical protein SAMN04488031_101827 [Roseovarius indicus]